MKEIIKFNHVDMSYQTKYQKVELFQDLNLSFNKGEYVIILGPSGSGKTTILNLIAGFVKLNSGEILVKDRNISDLTEREICNYRNLNIGVVFQFYNLIYSLNTEENILVPLLLAGMEKKDADCRVNELLTKVGLTNRRNHYPSELSGGEQQRIAIARALANNPEIILADEPTGNLDKKTGDTILNLLDEINQEGKTIIMVTHDMSVVNRATRVINMDEL